MKPDFKLKNISGIYQIKNNINAKTYVGRTKCFYKRCHQYLYDFNNRNIGHINDHLYRSICKYGIDNFSFEVLEYCNIESTPEREFYWINKLNSNDRNKGYNIRLDVNGKMLTSFETSLKISLRLKKEWKEGLRFNHSDKLKLSWSKRNRFDQSLVMSKNLTKYQYIIIKPDNSEVIVNYRQLTEMGLKNAISSFWKNKSNIVTVKNHIIERRKYEKI